MAKQGEAGTKNPVITRVGQFKKTAVECVLIDLLEKVGIASQILFRLFAVFVIEL